MAFCYTSGLDGIEPRMLDGGFWVGWVSHPPPETHLRILAGSSHRWLAIDDEREKVVGFITAISDGVQAAYIPLLEVLPEYQGRGIGSELVRRMLEDLKHLYQIDLLCDPGVQPFYERFGMKRATGMMIRNYDRQAGVLRDADL